jgi:hypothetical protein
MRFGSCTEPQLGLARVRWEGQVSGGNIVTIEFIGVVVFDRSVPVEFTDSLVRALDSGPLRTCAGGVILAGTSRQGEERRSSYEIQEP